MKIAIVKEKNVARVFVEGFSFRSIYSLLDDIPAQVNLLVLMKDDKTYSYDDRTSRYSPELNVCKEEIPMKELGALVESFGCKAPDELRLTTWGFKMRQQFHEAYSIDFTNKLYFIHFFYQINGYIRDFDDDEIEKIYSAKQNFHCKEFENEFKSCRDFNDFVYRRFEKFSAKVERGASKTN